MTEQGRPSKLNPAQNISYWVNALGILMKIDDSPYHSLQRYACKDAGYQSPVKWLAGLCLFCTDLVSHYNLVTDHKTLNFRGKVKKYP